MSLDLNKTYHNKNLELMRRVELKRLEVNRLDKICKLFNSFGYKENHDYFIQSC